MTDTSGFSADGQVQAIETVVGGGAELALLPQGNTVSHGDSVSDVQAEAAVIETVPESDFNVDAGSSFVDVGELSLAADVEYGAVDEGVLTDFAVLGDTAWILGEEIEGNPDTTGEEVTIPAGQTLYEIGNV